MNRKNCVVEPRRIVPVPQVNLAVWEGAGAAHWNDAGRGEGGVGRRARPAPGQYHRHGDAVANEIADFEPTAARRRQWARWRAPKTRSGLRRYSIPNGPGKLP